MALKTRFSCKKENKTSEEPFKNIYISKPDNDQPGSELMVLCNMHGKNSKNVSLTGNGRIRKFEYYLGSLQSFGMASIRVLVNWSILP